MNIVQLQNDLKDLSDQQLIQTQQTGSVPQYLVLAEMQRRKTMRQEAQSKPQQPSSVAEEITQGLAGMPQNPQIAMASGGIVSFAGGKSVSAYQKGVSEACYKNEATGKTECAKNPRLMYGPKHTKFKTQKFATGQEVKRDEVRKLLESDNRQFDEEGNLITGPEVTVAGKKEKALGRNQILPSTAMQPGYEKYGATDIFSLADEMGVEYGDRNEENAKLLLANEMINDEFASRYQTAMANRFGEDKSFEAYHAGPGNVARGNIGPKTEAYAAKAAEMMTGDQVLADLGYGRGGLGPGESEPTRSYPTDNEIMLAEAMSGSYVDRKLGEGLADLARSNNTALKGRVMSDAEREQMKGIPNMEMPEGILAAMGEEKMPLRGGEQLSTQELKDMAAERRAIRSEKAPVETWTVDDFDANPEIKAAFQRYLKHQEAYHDQQDANKEYAARNYLGKALNEPGRFFFGADEQLKFYPDFASFYQDEQLAKQKPMTAEEGIAGLGEQKMTLRGGERDSTAEQRKAKEDRAATNAAADEIKGGIVDTLSEKAHGLLKGITSVRDKKLSEIRADEQEYATGMEAYEGTKPAQPTQVGAKKSTQAKGDDKVNSFAASDKPRTREGTASQILGYGAQPEKKKGIDALLDDKLFQLGVGMIRRGGQTGDFGLAFGQATQDVIDAATKADASAADNQAAMDRALIAYEAAIYKADADALVDQKNKLIAALAKLDEAHMKKAMPTPEDIQKYETSRKWFLDRIKDLERGTVGREDKTSEVMAS